MPTYAYECRRCGAFDARRPMAQADEAQPCSTCGEPARRVFTAPGFRRASPLTRALDAQERSAHAPEVVSAVPQARRGPARAVDPRQARLPRP
jgi:putative FmdB family regulatory protein